MRPRLTPRDWLQTAIAAPAIAAQLTDPCAKRVMEETADECELIAQDVGEIVAALFGKDPDSRSFGRRVRSLGADIDTLLARTKALHAATVKEADELRAQRAQLVVMPHIIGNQRPGGSYHMALI